MDNSQNKKTAKTKELIETNLSIKSKISSLINFLPYCEYELILYMIEKNAWVGEKPLPPEGFKKDSGSIELGLFLYWLNNPDQIHMNNLSTKEFLEVSALILALDYLLPKTKITKENYSFLQTNELIYVDGTVLSTEKYATFDQGWFVAFLNLVESVVHNLWYSGSAFPTTPPPTVELKGAKENSVSIAIIGDWGAGSTSSKKLMNQLTSMNPKPDYIIHVGDVYYAGTPLATSPNGSHYFSAGEEYENLINLWPQKYKEKSFTLNSNHEMYSGANGLFYDALGASHIPAGANTPYSAQQGASCFALEFGDWTLLGLDSAYMSKVTDAFMTGSIGDETGFQSKWIKSLNLDPKKTVVFTHHNGFSGDCKTVSPLWFEIRNAIGGDPFAWYWGHIHNGIVYKDEINIPEKKPTFTTNTLARCVGHSSLPYGLATSLENNKNITWKANSPMPSPPKQLYNGFAVIILSTENNKLDSFTETFFDLSTKNPVYKKTLIKK